MSDLSDDRVAETGTVAYREELSFGRVRTFTLLPGALRISRRRRRSLVLPLRWLEPRPVRRRRIAEFRAGAGYLLTGVVAMTAAMLHSRDFLDAWNTRATWQGFAAGMGLTFVLLGLYLMFTFRRKVEHATFRIKFLRITIARNGPDAEKFHPFIERVVDQIRFVQGAK